MFAPYPTGLETKGLSHDAESAELLRRRRAWALRVLLARLVWDLAVVGLVLLAARRTGAWQLYQLALPALLPLALNAAGLFAYRRGRAEFGVTLSAAGLLFFLPISVAFVSGFGIPVALAGVLFTALPTMLVLPPQRASRFFFLSLLVGLALALLDTALPVGVRLPIPEPFERILLPVGLGLLVVDGLLLFRQFTNFSLRAKLIYLFLMVALIPLGILAFFNGRANQAALTEEANQALFASASKTATSVDNFIQAGLNAIQAEAQIPMLRELLLQAAQNPEASPDFSDVEELLATFQLKDSDHILNYVLLDKEGLVLEDIAGLQEGKLPPFFAVDTGFRNNFRLVLLTDLPSVSPIKFWPRTGRASLYFTARVSDLEGKPIGGLVAQYDARILQGLVEESNGLAGQDSFGVLFDDFNIHLAHGTAPETLFKSAADLDPNTLDRLKQSMRLPDLPLRSLSTNLPELQENLEQARAEPFFSATDVATGGRLNQVAVAPLETQPWKVAFFQPQDVFLEPVERQSRLTLALAVVIASAVILAAAWASQLVARPIIQLTDVSLQVAEGDLNSRSQVITGDEIGTLAKTFNLMTDRLQATLRGLEAQVADRTQDLERRAVQLQAAARVAQEAATIRDINRLMTETAILISDRFDFYHCGIFLLDDRREFAVLRAASSEGGRQMLERGHRLGVGVKGIVGYVAASGEPRIALDVGRDATYFDNPDLPMTRSELALPLKIQDQVIGVLDVQSTEGSAFTQEDVEVLQILADQIALAIDNTRLLESRQESLQELEALYRQQVQNAWEKRLEDQALSYRYDGTRIEAMEVPSTGPLVLQGEAGPDGMQKTDRRIQAEIALRGQSIGSLVLQRTAEQPAWTEAERSMVLEIMEQMSLALENTRLYEETQLRAEIEHLTSEVSSRMRESLDIETVLRTAVQEIQRVLDLDEVVVGLGPGNSGNGARTEHAQRAKE